MHTAQDIPTDLIQYWLGDGWTFGLGTGLRRYGCCYYRERRITISVHALLHACGNPVHEATLCNMVLHEIAHAMAWECNKHAGHGLEWHYWCRVIGCGLDKACDNRANALMAAGRAGAAASHRQ